MLESEPVMNRSTLFVAAAYIGIALGLVGMALAAR